MTGIASADKTPLCSTYRKPWINVKVWGFEGKRKEETISLPPVLYHGTTDIVINYMMNKKHPIKRLCTSPLPDLAVSYARRSKDKIEESRPCFLYPTDESERGIAYSLVLLDRDTLLKVARTNFHISLCYEELGGLTLRSSPLDLFPFPSDSVIGILDLYPIDEGQRLATLRFRILNSSLWQENFLQDPPFSSLTFRMPGLAPSSCWALALVNHLFTKPFLNIEPQTLT